MSVQVNQYHCYGYMLPYEKAKSVLIERFGSEEKFDEILDLFHDSAFDSKIVEVDGVSMILDGMNGKYLFFGKIYDKSDNYEHLQTIVFKKPKKYIKVTLAFKIKEYFGDEFKDLTPETLMISHYR